MVGCGFLTWAAVIGVGVWLDIQQIDPWRDIFGLHSGRLLRFYNSTALLTCSQLSFLILWRRSRSRKDFSGQYRVWFWVAAVCSVFCVATVTRFHELWAGYIAGRSDLVWTDAKTVCWMVPATTMLLSAMHLMRRDMPSRSASRQWVNASRIVAALAGVNLLMGSLVWPTAWVSPVGAALGALWPTVFASSLFVHARFVTHVTNEASRESLQPRQPSRWEMRVRTFARLVAQMASEEWQIQRAKRTAAKTAKGRVSTEISADSPVPSDKLQSKSTPSARRRMAGKSPSSTDDKSEINPASKAVNLRPLSRPEEVSGEVAASLVQPLDVHPAHPIPPPHFEVTDEVEVSGAIEYLVSESDEEDSASPSSSIPEGYTPEQWKSLSKKERKRLLRAASMR